RTQHRAPGHPRPNNIGRGFLFGEYPGEELRDAAKAILGRVTPRSCFRSGGIPRTTGRPPSTARRPEFGHSPKKKFAVGYHSGTHHRPLWDHRLRAPERRDPAGTVVILRNVVLLRATDRRPERGPCPRGPRVSGAVSRHRV